MNLFENLVRETNEKFNLDGRASDLLAALLAMMTDEKSGGLKGFLDLFHRVGLGRVADSWVSGGANSALSNQQTTDALGTTSLENLASRANFTAAAALPALSYLIPATVDTLTPDGVIPNSSKLAGLLGSYYTGATPIAGATAAAATGDNSGTSILRYIVPLILLGLLAFLGYQFCGRPNQNVPVATALNTNQNAVSTNSNTAAAVTNSNANAAVSATNPVAATSEADIKAANDRAAAELSKLNAQSSPAEVVRVLNLTIIKFATNSANIPPDNEKILKDAAAILKNAPADTRIEVGGHTDSDGKPDANLKLSQRRAEAVRNELVKLGVNSKSLTAKGFGATKPRADNTTPEGKFQNRRIEYTLQTSDGTTATTENSNVKVTATPPATTANSAK